MSPDSTNARSPRRSVRTIAARVLVDGFVASLFLLLASVGLHRVAQLGDYTALLPLAMNGLLVGLYIFRREAASFSHSPMAWLLAILGTTLPLLLRPAADGDAQIAWLGLGLQQVGLMATLLALLSLQRSLGIVPANRGIRVGGMYRWVRHPLYAAELTFVSGYVLQHPSPANMALFCLEVALQWARAEREEAFLAQDDRYRTYLTQVKYRFVPGLV